MTGYKLKPKEAADPNCEACDGTGLVGGERCICTLPCTTDGCDGPPGGECKHCGAQMDADEDES